MQIKEASEKIHKTKKEISKILVGQKQAVNGILRSIIADGHCLIEGVPGIAKTLLVKTLSKITGGTYSRIQFTVDLLPTDITGITAYQEGVGFYTVKGPVFANFILADEINRATPKTQAALLEAMQERTVTIGKETYPLPEPFFLMATQNPIEQRGVYPLPEAQKDRFIFKLIMSYPSFDEELNILEQNITLKKFEDYDLNQVLSLEEIKELQKLAKTIQLKDNVKEYIVHLVTATRKPEKYDIESGKYIRFGASPRASIAMFIGAKVDAMMQGKDYVTPQNVKNVVFDVLRHRIILNYEGEAKGITTDEIIKEIISKVPIP